MASTRRQFFGAGAGAGLTLIFANRAFAGTDFELDSRPKVQPPTAPSEKIRFACIGVGGKGDSDTADAARFGEIVAICDTDENTLNAAGMKYPNAKKYTDFRKLFDEMSDKIDAVTVSTPDHNHAIIAISAMMRGKHVFCQKPLTHSLWETRKMAEAAVKFKVATQMGNQGTADSGLRRQAAQVRAGLLGEIKEIHVWTNRPIWAQGMERAASVDAPATLHWDQWLGPAPERPFAPGYHNFSWRGWWDFGTGALGDMGCHTLNMPFMALDLRDPIRTTAQTSGHKKDSFPSWSTVTFEFEKRGDRPALKVFWYDGNKKPPVDLLEGGKLQDSGSLLIGSKDKLYIPGDYGSGGVVIGGTEPAEVTFPVSPGHFEEFARAVRGGEPAMSNFPGYAGPLTEMVLAGNLAVYANGPTIEWDAKRLKAKNAGDAEERIHPKFRKGFDLIPNRW